MKSISKLFANFRRKHPVVGAFDFDPEIRLVRGVVDTISFPDLEEVDYERSCGRTRGPDVVLLADSGEKEVFHFPVVHPSIRVGDRLAMLRRDWSVLAVFNHSSGDKRWLPSPEQGGYPLFPTDVGIVAFFRAFLVCFISATLVAVLWKYRNPLGFYAPLLTAVVFAFPVAAVWAVRAAISCRNRERAEWDKFMKIVGEYSEALDSPAASSASGSN